MVDNDKVSWIFGYEDTTDPQGVGTINLYLDAGQIVRVANYLSTIVHGTDSSGTMQSWFTGFLLFAL